MREGRGRVNQVGDDGGGPESVAPVGEGGGGEGDADHDGQGGEAEDDVPGRRPGQRRAIAMRISKAAPE